MHRLQPAQVRVVVVAARLGRAAGLGGRVGLGGQRVEVGEGEVVRRGAPLDEPAELGQVEPARGDGRVQGLLPAAHARQQRRGALRLEGGERGAHRRGGRGLERRKGLGRGANRQRRRRARQERPRKRRAVAAQYAQRRAVPVLQGAHEQLARVMPEGGLGGEG